MVELAIAETVSLGLCSGNFERRNAVRDTNKSVEVSKTGMITHKWENQ